MILLTVLSFLLHKLYTDTGDLARDLAAHAQRVAVVEAQMGAVRGDIARVETLTRDMNAKLDQVLMRCGSSGASPQ